MEFKEHKTGDSIAIELVSDEILIGSEQDVLDILANVRYLYDSSKIILHKKNLSEDFFSLKSGLAGAVMQKFSNYRVRAAIIGIFTGYGNSMDAFIRESNRSKQVVFTPDASTALEILKGHIK